MAEKQYEYFSDPQNGYINGEVIHIKSAEELLSAGKTGGIYIIKLKDEIYGEGSVCDMN